MLDLVETCTKFTVFKIYNGLLLEASDEFIKICLDADFNQPSFLLNISYLCMYKYSSFFSESGVTDAVLSCVLPTLDGDKHCMWSDGASLSHTHPSH